MKCRRCLFLISDTLKVGGKRTRSGAGGPPSSAAEPTGPPLPPPAMLLLLLLSLLPPPAGRNSPLTLDLCPRPPAEHAPRLRRGRRPGSRRACAEGAAERRVGLGARAGRP